MAQIYLGIGSNIAPAEQVPRGLAALYALLGPLQLSPIYQSAAVGFNGEPFYNLVVQAHSPWPLAELKARLRALEYRLGRPLNAQKCSARHFDVDLLLYDALICHEPIALPHPDILAHAFVLRPLAELAPEMIHPHCGQSFAALWQTMAAAGVQAPLQPVTLPAAYWVANCAFS
ncbi:MAG: 2-amino-4-hydroxy-6-hydroxymethyldihydropteridine diphosphokinase [Aeromonas sp.]